MTRTSASILLVLAALAAPAFAQPKPPPAPEPAPVARLAPPTGWTNDDTRAGVIVRNLANDAHFGGVAVGLDGQYMRSPVPGAILVATQVVTEELPADPAGAATAELHGARDGADATAGGKVLRWVVNLDPRQLVHEALLEWTDPSVGTIVVSRTLVFRTKTALARIAAECVLAPEAAVQRAACEAALVSLAPNTAALEPIAVAAELPKPAAVPSPDLPPAPSIGPLDGEMPSTIMVKPAPAKRDRRPLYVIGGLLLLGAVYWWNRRERQRREPVEAAIASDDKPDDDSSEDKPS